MTDTRRCPTCQDPLVRRDGERVGHFNERRFCGRKCSGTFNNKRRAPTPPHAATTPWRERPQWSNPAGYMLVRVSGRRSAQLVHRLVMEEALGRPLLPTERVHHINGKRDDNRPENLELWVTTHPPGQRVPDLVAWARGIIAQYGDDL